MECEMIVFPFNSWISEVLRILESATEAFGPNIFARNGMQGI